MQQEDVDFDETFDLIQGVHQNRNGNREHNADMWLKTAPSLTVTLASSIHVVPRLLFKTPINELLNLKITATTRVLLIVKMKGVFSAPGDYIHFKSQVPLHKIPIGTKQWRYYDFGPKVVPPLICLPGTAGTADVYYKQIMSLSIKFLSTIWPFGSSKWRILLWNLSIPISYIARHYERGDLQGLEIGGDEGYRVISVDIPRVWNHHEWIQAFEKFLDAIDVHHIHLYGTSLGGFLAQLFAQHRPRRVRSLILSNSFLETRSFSSAMPWAPIPEAVHSGSASTTDGIILPITGHKLNGQNFIQWAQSIRIFICGKGKEEYLTGAIVQPKEDDPGYRTWKLENSMVMSWLINSMTNDIGENFMYYGTAKEIWDAARETYSNIDNTSAIFEIKSILQDLRQGDSTVTEYFNILTRYWQQLDIYEELVWKCPKDGLLYKKVIEKERIYKFLLGLNKNLDEQNREGQGYTAVAEEDTSGTSSNPRPFSKEQLEALQKMFQQTLQSIGTTIGTASVAQKGIFSHALNVRQENHTTWIVDSGASDHMTGNLMVFHEYTPCHNNSSVRIADGTLSRPGTLGRGLAMLRCVLTLPSES
ncbi:Maspardin [Vitis vinifera]|uniref:Maspardin n=1 Tax=Vitis vinifera TaxID=29760 RepID=A0A438K2A4_VITVI|nr:Maspardin [Vitis vinifera]